MLNIYQNSYEEYIEFRSNIKTLIKKGEIPTEIHQFINDTKDYCQKKNPFIFNVATVKRISKMFDVELMVNLYGPSKTTLAKNFYSFTIDALDLFSDIPVGKPLPDTEYKINNTGSVFVNTQYPSLGYINRNPFIKKNGKLWFDTKDIGVIKDNLLFLKGRFDDLVKVNGIRIHLSEIKTKLDRIDDVEDSCIIQNDSGKICAYFEGTASETNIRDCFSTVLRKEIIPTFIYKLDVLPKTQSGKIDRNALIVMSNEKSNTSYPLENSSDFLFDIWRKISNYRGEIKEQDSVFALGGDSLNIVEYSIQLSIFTNKNIEYWDIYEHPKFNQLRIFIEGLSDKNKQFLLNDNKKLTEYPMNPQQKRYKNIYIPFENGNWCNMLAIWDFGQKTVNELSKALNILVKSPSKNLVIWNIHHLICDGYSQGIIKNEIDCILAGEKLEISTESYAKYALAKGYVTKKSKQY